MNSDQNMGSGSGGQSDVQLWTFSLTQYTHLCRHSVDPVGTVVQPADHSMLIQDIPGCSRQVKSRLIQRLFLALDQLGAVISAIVLIQIRINRSAVSQCRSTRPETLRKGNHCRSLKLNDPEKLKETLSNL